MEDTQPLHLWTDLEHAHAEQKNEHSNTERSAQKRGGHENQMKSDSKHHESTPKFAQLKYT
jgi:hypothetical protein